MSSRLLIGLLLLTSWANAETADTLPVRLNTSAEEPYQVVMKGELRGLSVDVLQCIFDRLQRPYDIKLTSLSRARHNVSQRTADGFFSSAPDSQVDGYAELSAPLLVEKWYWYALDPHVLNRPIWDRHLRIGSVLGSNSLTWLEARGIPVAQKVTRLEQLVDLLHRGRIDLLLADSHVMDSLPPQKHWQRPLLQRFVRYSPLGVYFSRSFLDEQPDFLKTFNQQVESCAPPGTPLSDEEQTYLRQLISQHIDRWAYHPDLLQALRDKQQQGNSQDSIDRLDQQWRGELLLDEKPLIRSVLSSKPSSLLKGIANLYQPLFNELFISAVNGELVASSETTSDYWQGDELDFKQARHLKPGDVHISDIQYDGSTQNFQSKASAPLYDPLNGQFLGVISLGVNIETAFGDNLP